MSVWTQITGSVRLDNYNFLNPLKDNDEAIKELMKDLGDISTFYNDVYETKLPLGSEGSLKYEIIHNDEEGSLQNVMLVFHGSLRDYSNLGEVLDYFKNTINYKTLKNHGLEIRQGIFTAYCELGDYLHAFYENETEKWVELQ